MGPFPPPSPPTTALVPPAYQNTIPRPHTITTVAGGDIFRLRKLMSALLYKIFGENSLKNIPLAATGNVPFLNAAVVELRSLDRCRLFLTTCSAFSNNNPRQATNIWRSRTLLNLEAFFLLSVHPLISVSLSSFHQHH